MLMLRQEKQVAGLMHKYMKLGCVQKYISPLLAIGVSNVVKAVESSIGINKQ
jgi:hypothetical protein